ncbi:MAG: response regulator, partial [Terriglobales bacterium]
MSALLNFDQSSESPIRVLLLEDNPADVELSLRALARGGLRVEAAVASTLEEFEKSIRERPPHIVLADYNLPSCTGLDALQLIRRVSPNLPLILITGMLGEQRAVECIKLGVADYVLKDQLLRLPTAVRQVLEQRAVREESARNAKLLEESAASFRFLFAKNPIPMMVCDRETLRYLEVNDICVEQYGYSRDEFLRMRATDIRTPEEAVRLSEFLTDESSQLTHAGVWQHKTKSGKTIDAEIMLHGMEFASRPAWLIAALSVT